MNASELNDTERLALMALLKLMISADKQLSEEESQVLRSVADELGTAVFKATQQQAEAALKTIDDMKEAVSAVERPEARKLLYSFAVRAAESDQLIAKEVERLFWIAEQWGLDVDPTSGQLR